MSDSIPKDRRYLQSHEWHKLDGDIVTIGITQSAADELTDITYVKFPTVGQELKANTPFGEIESVKATADLFTGVSGTVTAVNNVEITKNPSLINIDPFGRGWLIKIKIPSDADLKKLLSADDYIKKTGH